MVIFRVCVFFKTTTMSRHTRIGERVDGWTNEFIARTNTTHEKKKQKKILWMHFVYVNTHHIHTKQQTKENKMN